MISVSRLEPDDRPAWQELFGGYNAFYGRTLPADRYDRAWREFQRDDRMHALGARLDGRLVGIAHFLVHASTTSADVCYLQDLFTAPEARGKGVARALIGAVEAWAGRRGCDRLYWQTKEDNHTARRLYDQVAENRGFINYVIPLQNAGNESSMGGREVEEAVDAMARALHAVRDRDWHVPAGGLEWTCWETVEHVCDDLFAYAGQLGPKAPPLDRYVPFGTRERRPGGPDETIFTEPGVGVDGLLMALWACGGLLAATVKTAPPDTRAYHGYGISDPAGFAAMGVVEILVHMHDIAEGLGIEWIPDGDMCRSVLDRLFPDAPTDTDPWPTLLWATGRGDIPGHARLSSWRWDSTVRTA